MLNVELVKQLIDDIKTHPNHFYMNSWIHTEDHEVLPSKENQHPCGTTCCIAGRVAVLSGVKIDDNCGWLEISRVIKDGSSIHVSSYAAAELGLSKEDSNKLFYTQDWPLEYRVMQEDAGDGFITLTEAEAAVALLESMIEKGGVWW